MAKRRSRWGKGSRLAFGLSQGMQDFLGVQLRERTADRQAERIAQRQEEQDVRTESRQQTAARQAAQVANRQTIAGKLPDVASGALSPSGLKAMMSALGMDGMMPSEFGVDYAGTGEPQAEAEGNAQATDQALASLRPPVRRSFAPMGKAIDEAQTLSQVPSIESLINTAKASDDRATDGGLDPSMLLDPTEPESMLSTLDPSVRDYVNQAMAKSQALQRAPGERVTIENPDGSQTVRTPTAQELATGITTTPNATAQGTAAGQGELAKAQAAFDPAFEELMGRSKAKIEAIREGLTRQAKIATAAGIAGETKRAELAPDIVAAEVDKAGRLGKHSNQSTESERRAAANWTPLVNAHVNAMKYEAEGLRLTAGAIEITGSSWLNPVLGGMVDQKVKEYAQAARDFVTTLGYIRSGVAVRADEVDKFLATMFGFDTDDEALMQQKVQSREILLGAMQAMVGRSAPEAARVLAGAINAGQIPATLLNSLDMDPQIIKAMLPLLTAMPQFDAQGNPIYGKGPRP